MRNGRRDSQSSSSAVSSFSQFPPESRETQQRKTETQRFQPECVKRPDPTGKQEEKKFFKEELKCRREARRAKVQL
jgi:hypothetical protein